MNKKSKVSIVPLADRVVIRPLSADEIGTKTKSGIIIPDTIDKEKSERAEVVAIGEGRYEDGKLIPIKVKVGDQVIFSKYGGDNIKIEGEDYIIISESSLLAVVK
jgi:chaperonin GroES